MDVTQKDPVCYVGELGPGLGVNKDAPNLGNRVDIYDKTGKRLARLGDIFPGEKPGQFIAPTASPSTRAVTFTSAKCRGRLWVSACSRRASCAAYRSLRS